MSHGWLNSKDELGATNVLESREIIPKLHIPHVNAVQVMCHHRHYLPPTP